MCGNLQAGGAERQWSLLIPRLRELGFDVNVVTLDGRGEYFEELQTLGVPVACADLRYRADPVGLGRAIRLSGHPSVVITRPVSAHLVGHLIAAGHRARHVATEHLGSDPRGLRPYRTHQRLLLRLVRPHTTAVVAVAGTQASDLVRQGYRPHAVRVIANGVDSDPLVRDRRTVRAELGIPADAFLAVLVAALRPEKRASVFVERVTAAHAAEPSIHGLVVGDGPDKPRVLHAIGRSGGVVRVLGYRGDALDIVHAADTLCLTSAVEAQPMSVLEAMSVARPVVATDVGGVSEVVVDGETGWLVPPNRITEMDEALVFLARNRWQAAQLGEAGRRRQRRLFSVDTMASEYARLLAELGCRPQLRPRVPAAQVGEA
jgi:glycosyltransferase involved in cell wall biosynthesis